MVIKNALILDEDFNIVEESAIHIKDGRFHKIGKNLDLNTEGEDVINVHGEESAEHGQGVLFTGKSS